MGAFSNKIGGVIVFIVMLLLLIFTSSWMITIGNEMPTLLLKAMFWIGYAGIAISALIISPYKMIISQTKSNVASPFKGFTTFFIYNLLLPIFYAITNSVAAIIIPDATSNGFSVLEQFNIISLFFYLISIVAMIVYPIYVCIVQDAEQDTPEITRV